ncbi:MAG: D-glycero-beta-D-manno-heptose 1-phosphate adenylyltransferase [Planctomycetota bacterium]|nr:MAG: D-glycero-beta-D-manno-heptose 1-phosphate adenylyltransferase [Planctomycetota bacterium]
MDAPRKVLPREELAARLRAARAAGRSAVLCNGVFDLLHVGHVRALAEARALGDLLVVAVNDDASAARLKGPDRPLVPAAERSEVLAALACVDFVTVYGEDTAAETLRLLQPAVHAKGRDYDAGRIPAEEQRVAAELHIRLALVGDEKRRSSSELARRLRCR